MTPLWMHVAMTAVGSPFPFHISDRTVAELLFGPGTFAPFSADEAAHLRDARVVLYAFLGLAVLSVAFLALAARRSRHEVRFWQALRRGGAALVVGTVVLGVIGFFAFDIGFELFHRIFFPGGNWSFDPDSNLIRLYPYAFWQLTAGALGVLCVAAGAAIWLYARKRATRLEARP